MSCGFFKSYTSNDLVGLEVCGCLKNLLSLGGGIVEGLGYGSNTMAAYITRGAMEIQLLARHYGADPKTILGLAGVGDLMLCCYGSLSRNRTCGYKIAKGMSVEEAVKSIGTVEGVPTLTVIHKFIVEKGLEDKLKIIKYDRAHLGPSMTSCTRRSISKTPRST